MKTIVAFSLGVGISFVLAGTALFVLVQKNLVVTHPSTEVSDKDVYALVQNYRSSTGKSQYVWSETLCYIAAKRVFDIQNNWSHDGMDKFMKEDMSRFPDILTIGENLAKDYSTASEVVNGWLKSPGHKANLDKHFTHTCVRCNKNYCVQTFGNL